MLVNVIKVNMNSQIRVRKLLSFRFCRCINNTLEKSWMTEKDIYVKKFCTFGITWFYNNFFNCEQNFLFCK